MSRFLAGSEQQRRSSMLALEALALLLPHKARSDLARALEERGASASGYLALLEACLAHLDASLFEVGAAPRDLVLSAESIPALEADEPHRLVIGRRRERFEILDALGRRTVDEADIDAGRVRRFLVVSHALARDRTGTCRRGGFCSAQRRGRSSRARPGGRRAR